MEERMVGIKDWKWQGMVRYLVRWRRRTWWNDKLHRKEDPRTLFFSLRNDIISSRNFAFYHHSPKNQMMNEERMRLGNSLRWTTYNPQCPPIPLENDRLFLPHLLLHYMLIKLYYKLYVSHSGHPSMTSSIDLSIVVIWATLISMSYSFCFRLLVFSYEDVSWLYCT